MTPTNNDRLGDLTRDSFDALDDGGKLGVLFDILSARLHKTDRRIDKLEGRKRLDTGMAAAAGFVGGFIAEVVGKFR